MNELVISQGENAIYLALLDEFQRLIEIKPYSLKQTGMVGFIFLGIVRKKIKGIRAYFIDFGQEKDGYLPFNEVERPLSIGETVMVQITKDSYQTKGAKLTSYISLSGEYVVLVTDSTKIHFSSKLPEDAWTKEMKKELIQLQKTSGLNKWGAIVRTNAYSIEPQKILDEVKTFLSTYERILKIQAYRPSKTCIFEPQSQWLKYVQNMNKSDIGQIHVDHKETKDLLEDYLTSINLRDEIKVDFVEGDLFLRYDLGKKIHKALLRKVWLSSGASIIIDRTEAMVVIDVNSDKNVSKINSSRNIFKINCEAAKEISRQIRLRNLSGIIIIDFIDMNDDQHKKKLVRCLQEYLEDDHIRTHVHGMTRLGLMELTRKRVEPCLEDLLKENEISLDTASKL